MRIGLVVNPIAGMGGSVGLAGTDGVVRLRQAEQLGAQPLAGRRAASFLQPLQPVLSAGDAELLTLPRDLGADVCRQVGIPCQVIPVSISDYPNLTQAGVAALLQASVDLLVFVGGDGTARDVLAQLPQHVCALGVPAGVKMHSGVFAVTPQAAASVVQTIIDGGLVALHQQEVKDFELGQDEHDQLQVVTFGELLVPDRGGYMQHTKVGGVESEPLVAEEIAAYIADTADASSTFVIGPGSTCLAIKQKLGLAGTLRGFDVVGPGLALVNVSEQDLLQLLEQTANILVIVSFTRQQGFLLGRGNQQLSAACLSQLRWPEQVCVVGSRTKLASLDGRPLLVDTSDPEIDLRLTGVIAITAGYDDQLLYQVAADYTAGAQ